MLSPEALSKDLPDADAALRFLHQLGEKHPKYADRLKRNDALLSDVLALVSYSPLLSTTLLQNPEYLSWLDRKRTTVGVRGKDQLLESLARFALTNSTLEPNVLLARFRRRELLRIFLADIRRLATISEITEEISNLADAILENALRFARQELDNRYGRPEQTDGKGRTQAADLCIVSLGKLGSLELNYSSDIDLLFIYSEDGKTSGNGSRGSVTNREYFVKLGETIRKMIDSHTGEGAAYRVDMRLRPHGRVGALALSLADTVRYYRNEAHAWERQVLIRSRASAGDASIFRDFSDAVVGYVFASDIPVGEALTGVHRSKEQIDKAQSNRAGFNVKLGTGGIREIEFIAQALQLAYGGSDPWLRVSHTLISLSRLADRKLIHEHELTDLAAGYEFLRRIEHVLQMENGLQVHTVPSEPERRELIARKMGFPTVDLFDAELERVTNSVSNVFRRIFDREEIVQMGESIADAPDPAAELLTPIEPVEKPSSLDRYSDVSIRFREQIAADPKFRSSPPDLSGSFVERNYLEILAESVERPKGFREKLNSLRRIWNAQMLEMIAWDIDGKADLRTIKKQQNALAEASMECALQIAKQQMEERYSMEFAKLPVALMGLGKLGGGGIDYESDLDLVIAYDEERSLLPENISAREFYNRFVEMFVNVISAMTRSGSLYRVDLRLRPYGKDGAAAISQTAFINYIRQSSAIWELLAYVKIRASGGDMALAQNVEKEIRTAIHERARNIDPTELAAETARIRFQLQQKKSVVRRKNEIDIKYGEGGMLDIYFAIRFLQLRDDVPDTENERSSLTMLGKLNGLGSLSDEDFAAFDAGYSFLSKLDHTLRLIIGRSTRMPLSNVDAMSLIADRMGFSSIGQLIEQLTLHRINIRTAFENIVGI